MAAEIPPRDKESLEQSWIDKEVRVDSTVPELKRFGRRIGHVKAVNRSGRALVEFQGTADQGWYDIDPRFLTAVNGLPPMARPEPPAQLQSWPEEHRRRSWQRLRDWLWGYDFFVSYHWASGGVYAVNLAQILRSNGFDVFLDRADYASGDDWKRMGQIALRNTQRLVLVATNEAVFGSKPVEHEVLEFSKRNRQIVPICFGYTLNPEAPCPSSFSEEVWKRIRGTTLGIPQPVVVPKGKRYERQSDLSLPNAPATDQLLPDKPSKRVINELIRTHKVLRRRDLRALLTLIPAIAIIAFAIFAGISWWRSYLSERQARRSEQTAIKSAVAERKAKEETLVEKANVETEVRQTHKQIATVFWQDAVSTRDVQYDPIKAAHLLLWGGKHAILARDTAGIDDSLLSAAELSSICEQTFVETNPVWHAQMEPNGSLLFCSVERRVQDLETNGFHAVFDLSIRDLNDGRILRQIQAGTDHRGIHLIGSRFLAHPAGKNLELRSASNDAAEVVFENTKDIEHVCLSPDKASFWAASRTTLTKWSTDGTALKNIQLAEPIVFGVFSSNANWFVGWTREGRAAIHSLTGAGEKLTIPADEAVRGAAFSSDGTRLLTWNRKSEGRVWDCNNGGNVGSKIQDATGGEFLKDSKTLITWNFSQVQSINLESGKVIWTTSSIPLLAGAKPHGDGKRLLTWTHTGKLTLWEVNVPSPGMQAFVTPKLRMCHLDEINGATFCEADGRAISWAKDGLVRVWNLNASQPVGNYSIKLGKRLSFSSFIPDFKPGSIGFTLLNGTDTGNRRGGRDPLTATYFSADGKSALTWDDDKHLRFWNLENDKPIKDHENTTRLHGGVFSPNGELCVTWSNDWKLSFWNPKSGELIKNTQHPGSLDGLSFKSDSNEFLTWNREGVTRLWSVGSNDPKLEYKGTSGVTRAMFDTTSRRVVAIHNGEVAIWDASDAKPIGSISYNGYSEGVQLNANGRHLLIWNVEKVHVIDLERPTTVREIPFRGIIRGAGFQPNSLRVFVWGSPSFSSIRAADLFDENSETPLRSFESDNGAPIDSVVFVGDRRFVTWHSGSGLTLWSVDRSRPLCNFTAADNVGRIFLGKDLEDVLVWTTTGTASRWLVPRVPDSLEYALSDHEYRTGTVMDGFGNLRALTYREMQSRQLLRVQSRRK